MNKQKKLCITLFTPIIILSFFSFGTFNFFNLFGLAYLVKIISLLFLLLGVIAIIELKVLTRYKLFSYFIILFFSYFGFILTVIIGNVNLGIIQASIMLISSLFILGVSNKGLKYLTKGILLIAGIFSFFGVFVFISYLFDPSLLNRESIFLSNSNISDESIVAASIYDYFSFTSGDGFEFFGYRVTRVKGYSNEPSSTIVHYLAPAGFAFFYDWRYKSLGILMLLFSMVCISSLVGILSILGSIPIFFIFSLQNLNLKKFIVIGSVLFLIVLMTYSDYLVNSLVDIGDDIYNLYSYDLLARKEGSAIGRLQSYSNSIGHLFKNPIGGSSNALFTPTALWLQIGMIGGFVLILLYILYSLKLLNLALHTFSGTSIYKKYGISLLVSIYIVTFTISSYGWDRVPGTIMLFLFYRMIQDEQGRLLYVKGFKNN